MSFFSSFVLASSLLHIAAAAPTLAPRSLSCPASNNAVFQSGSQSYTIECGTDRVAGDMAAPNGQLADTLEACIAQCKSRAGCVLVDYAIKPKACYLKSAVGSTKADSGVIGARLVASSSTSTISIKAAVTSSTLVSPVGPTATAASAPTSAGSGKRGLAYNNPAMTKFFGGSGSKVSWMYDWSAAPISSPNPALKYIPMLWSNNADREAAWNAKAKAGIAGGADALLGYVVFTADYKHQI